ncbi:putative tRNA-splicing endonuclease subunit Sen2 [Paratrimastix pyriformis]|uniref:tRNA-intron lyase n=1 Tax=Paratrimastix pyriformis TaxID=342808 RepID=A0ABQ8UEH2_9EUKA|nr:putative tRNA-splicing endonuclease subunit Sen2 [Paratrimastix pyriformis]
MNRGVLREEEVLLSGITIDDFQKSPHFYGTKVEGAVALFREEAFFLAYSAHSLAIFEESTGHPISLPLLFAMFCRQNPRFFLRFLVYADLKARNWVIKDGFKFGSDFLLYSGSPEEVHAALLVTILNRPPTSQLEVHPVVPPLPGHLPLSPARWTPPGPELHDPTLGRPTWQEISTLNRLAAQVRKEALLCWVCPSDPILWSDLKAVVDQLAAGVQSPNPLLASGPVPLTDSLWQLFVRFSAQAAVNFMQLKRWEPQRTRE